MNKRITALLIILCSFILIIAACTSNNNESNEEPKKESPPTTTEETVIKDDVPEVSTDVIPVKFTFYGNYDWMSSGTFGDTPSTKWIVDNKKVEIEPINSGGAAAAKLNTMIASNTLPDVIQTDRGATVERLRAGNILVALDEYYEKYPNLKKFIGEETINMLRSEDGKIYQIPNWFTTTPNGNGGWFINKKIYNELGSPKLETFDDLYDYLIMVKSKYNNVVPLEIGNDGRGIGDIFAGIANDNPRVYFEQQIFPEDDQLINVIFTDEYKETLLLANKLFRERLISQDALTQTQDQFMEKLNTGLVAVMVDGDAANHGKGGHNSWIVNDPQGGYQAIWPLHKTGVDKNKVFPNYWNSLGWNVNVITKNAENPEAIFSYLDWLTGEEGQRVIVFGPQGSFWDEFDEQGYPTPNDAFFNTSAEEKGKYSLGAYTIVGNTTFVDTAKGKLEMARPEEKRDWAFVAQSNVFWKTSVNATEFVNLDPAPDSDEGIIAANIKELVLEASARMLFASSDEEVISILDKTRNDATKLGVEKLMEFKTNKWQENREKLGL